ncbi:MAG: ROK family protein [bacterium]
MYVIFDIGGTKTRISTSIDGNTVSKVAIFPTPQNFSESINIIIQTGRKFLQNKKPTAIAGGIAGIFNENKTKLENTAHLSHDWIGKPIAEILYNEFKSPVYLENDTAVAGLGETHFGSGKGYPIVAYITVSTGIGGVRIINGTIDEAAIGFEPGHQFLLINNTPHTLEYLVSGSGLSTQYGKNAADITDPCVWKTTTRFLSYGIHNTIVHWSPHAVILGGSLINEHAITLTEIITELQPLLTIFPRMPEIKASQLGDNSGLYGALCLIKIKNHSL